MCSSRPHSRAQTRLLPRSAGRRRARPRFGFLRIWVLLRRDGWPVNKKRVRRLYRLEGLQLRMRVRRRKHIALHRGPAPTPSGPTECWSMDFVHDALADGRPFRILTVVDHWSRHSPLLEVAARQSGRSSARREIGSSTARPSRGRSPSTTAPSFNRGRVKIGRIDVACSWISFDQASPWKTLTSNRVTAGCVMNA